LLKKQAESGDSMTDSFSRDINYLRISVTDRCNARCRYCTAAEFTPFPRSEILQYEEFLRLCDIMSKLGVQNFRITGGEPLVRKDCVQFIEHLKKNVGVRNVSLTTNGILLRQYIQDLANTGLDGINISLDSMERGNFAKITGVDLFDDVWDAIQTAVKSGMHVKINAVIIKDVNCHEILPLATIAEKMPVDVRFIELMPTIANTGLTGVPSADVLEILHAYDDSFSIDTETYGNGPARYYRSKKFAGKIGFIDPISHNFCTGCNRLRISSTGFLRLCLHHDEGVDLRGLLRGGASNAEIMRVIVEAVHHKPQKHLLQSEINLHDMSKIGG